MNFAQFFGASRTNTANPAKRTRVPLQEISNAVVKPSRPEPQNRQHQVEVPTIIDERPPFIPFVHVEYPIRRDDELCDCEEYFNIIYRSMRQKEYNLPQSKVAQTQISGDDRCKLIDSLCRLHYKTQLTTITFYRCVGILDRLTNIVELSTSNYLIFGYAAMFIASKFDDVVPLRMQDAVDISGGQFTIDDLKKAEIYLYNAIDFDLDFPTALFFEMLYLKLEGTQMSQEFFLLTRYIMELCMLIVDFINAPDSFIAAVSVMTARTLFGMEPWTEQLYGFTQYSFENLCPSVKMLHQLLYNNFFENSFVKRKYASALFKNVANIPIPPQLPPPFPFYQ